jgi:hypothetical protein
MCEDEKTLKRVISHPQSRSAESKDHIFCVCSAFRLPPPPH